MKKAILALVLMAVIAGSAAYAATITGTVTDSDGNAVEGAYVSVVACDSSGGNWNGQQGRRGRGQRRGQMRNGEFTVQTDANGTFLIENAPDNVNRIRAGKRAFGGTRQEITVPEGGTLNIDLQLPGNGEGQGRGGRGRGPRGPRGCQF